MKGIESLHASSGSADTMPEVAESGFDSLRTQLAERDQQLTQLQQRVAAVQERLAQLKKVLKRRGTSKPSNRHRCPGGGGSLRRKVHESLIAVGTPRST